jgi:hypothetical protein
LVRSQESHEGWDSKNLNCSSTVDIEVSPCLLPVFFEISAEFTSLKSLVGSENFLSSLLGELLIEEEITIGVAALSITALSFKSVGSDHRSDEDIIGVLGESVWDLSLIPVPSRPSINMRRN